MHHRISARGDVRITLKSLITGAEFLGEAHNLVMDFTLEELAKAFLGQLPDVKVTAIAVGTDPSPPSGLDTGCRSEIARRDGVNVEVFVTGRQVYARAVFPGDMANGRIREAAIFAGPNCLARVNDDRTKDSTMTMTVEWTFTLLPAS